LFLVLCVFFLARPRPKCARWVKWSRWSKPPAVSRSHGFLISALFPVLLRLALLPVFPVPVPRVADEFSYLLAADTYSHGRLTNPQHKLWKHFESLNILVRPTYASKYPPGQGLALAAGQILFHQPWAGVCLSIALMGAALFWMLEAYVNVQWALVGAVIAGLRFGIAGYWMNSYWGGALAAAGGALVIGALPRLPSWRSSAILGTGVVLLAITRPFEGLMLCIPVLCIPALWYARKAIVPALTVIALGLAAIAFQNWRVTGDPFLLPYTEHARQYIAAPAFIWQKMRPEILYLDPFLQMNYAKYEAEFVSGPFLARLLAKLGEVWLFFLGPALTLPFLFDPPLRRDPRLRYLWPILAFAAVPVLVERSFFAHYLAPFTAVFLVLIVAALRHLWSERPALAGGLITIVCIATCSATGLAIMQRYNYTFYSPPDWCCHESRPWERSFVISRLEALPEKQLLIVRYAMHQPLPAWVYNPADIDASKVVFARDFGPCGNQELLHYYGDRRKWLLWVDGFEYKLMPYPDHETCGG
jgi:hypothetical protein